MFSEKEIGFCMEILVLMAAATLKVNFSDAKLFLI
jgi:hypothetical protein